MTRVYPHPSSRTVHWEDPKRPPPDWDSRLHALFEDSEGNYHPVPLLIHSLHQVPEPVREVFLMYAPLMGMEPDPSPWVDLDPQVWGEHKASMFNEARAAFREKEEKLVAHHQLRDLWANLRSRIEGGSRDPFVLLDVALSARPSARQLCALQQLLNEVLCCWEKHDFPPGAGADTPWQLPVVKDAHWYGSSFWGELRSAAGKKDKAAARAVLDRADYWAHPRHSPGYALQGWDGLRRHLREYFDQCFPSPKPAPVEEPQTANNHKRRSKRKAGQDLGLLAVCPEDMREES
jgi:hypothetical protein